MTLVTEDGVLVHPGFFFDFPREAFLVLSLIVEPERLRPGRRPAAGPGVRERARDPRERHQRAAVFGARPDAAGGSGSSRISSTSPAGPPGAGQSIVQILPVMELPEHERSPYSALTSFALDPTYIALPNVPDFDALGGEGALDEVEQVVLADVRHARRVLYAEVRQLKRRWLRRAWEHFARVELKGRTRRADAFGTSAPGSRGGSRTTRCSGPSSIFTASAPGGNGRRRCYGPSPRPSPTPADGSTRRSSS